MVTGTIAAFASDVLYLLFQLSTLRAMDVWHLLFPGFDLRKLRV